MFACPGRPQLAGTKRQECILMLFNLEKQRDYYRICIMSYFEKIQFCCAIFKSEDVIDTFYSGMAIALHAFSPKISHRNIQKINIDCIAATRTLFLGRGKISFWWGQNFWVGLLYSDFSVGLQKKKKKR